MDPAGTSVWIDASAGVAGDMLVAALIDAGASLVRVQQAVDTVAAGAVRLAVGTVTRAGMRATRLDVSAARPDGPDRRWSVLRTLLDGAELAAPVRANARAVFETLAGAEGRVHGIPADEVHFHEVGAWDSIADVVGVCAALHDLGVTSVTAGEVAVGSGTVRSAHGTMPVPVPAVLELCKGWRVRGGGDGELATPTGMALLSTLAVQAHRIPDMRVVSVGVGAGTRDVPDRANVVRVVVGEPAGTDESLPRTDAVVVQANVDDLDPRVWPGVLAALLEAGASDAWLVPILMKKGRPGHTLHVLAPPGRVGALREVIFAHTTTFGVRETPVRKIALDRCWVDIASGPDRVAVKIAHRGGLIVSAVPEYEEAAALAARLGRPLRDVLAEIEAAARAAGYRPGLRLPGRDAPG